MVREDEVSMWGAQVWGFPAMSRRDARDDRARYGVVKRSCVVTQTVEGSGRKDGGGRVEMVDGRVKY